ncbi:substrate-binding periplasmic protein [Bowmanella denitrificans]|uniref:substrate-binding periplasmic protein n=1 Tax=Bowmanella denitrificans TaxID=366582 RepID=UPI001559B541|nr:transporter substrate-binding domain-containing protein [Bowmanella denitrificans]
MRYLWLLKILMGLMVGVKTAVAVSSTLIYPRQAMENTVDTDYAVVLLSRALQEAGLKHSLQPSRETLVQSRALKQLQLGDGIDVAWSMTSTERESALQPVRIPIYKGLYGWRLLMIKPESQVQLTQVNNLSDLTALTLIQGRGWPDTHVLQANGVRVAGTPHTEDLFDMLQRQRGIAFPRSVLEIWREHDYHQGRFAVETHLVLYYPTALYYFFRPSDTSLANEVEKGLRRLLETGEFDRLFMQYHGEDLEKAKLHQRTIIPLWNPLLPAQTPLEQDNLWYRP